MTGDRTDLPQLNGHHVTTEGGMETTLQYKHGFELPHFCLFHLLNEPRAVDALRDYHRAVVEASIAHGFGAILEGLHYRASSDWGSLLGYSREGLAEINIRGVEFYRDIGREYRDAGVPLPIGGVIGPRGDAYDVGKRPGVAASEDYHATQIETLARAGVDLVSAVTLSFVDEAIGIANAARAIGVPIVISFTLDKSAKLETGESLREAIEKVDAETGDAPAYYLINCTHPLDFEPALEPGAWLERLFGFMPNAATLDKGTLCQLGHLEEGDPVELGEQMGELAKRYPHMTVWGGCCGTDARHIGEICRHVSAVRGIARGATAGASPVGA